ncbi:hypothetical protein E2C01_078710 [Portunus trituberculatus]|uniref:Uncharacterized protein n=1 Tax=Portunus trituberculatus TaxID=210409 RepID=A0A5B7IQW0_PORTR|nr:hypothetical protein [Portunus trituberculatus]
MLYRSFVLLPASLWDKRKCGTWYSGLNRQTLRRLDRLTYATGDTPFSLQRFSTMLELSDGSGNYTSGK